MYYKGGVMMENIIDDIMKFNHTKREYDDTLLIPQLFELQVEKNYDKVAVIHREKQITYGQLNEKANRLANALRKKGVKPNQIVGLMVHKSVDTFVGMMGILKAGGCYIPIDPKFPQSRVEYMLENSKAQVLVTQSELASELNENYETIFIDQSLEGFDKENLELVNQSTDLAYVIYTSGSTGKPKGVMLTHKNVHNFICGMIDIIDFNSNKRIVSVTTISFDIFVLESLLPLSCGLSIVVANPITFYKDIEGQQADMIQTTPTTMSLIMRDERTIDFLSSLSDIMLGGEPFPKRLLEELKKISHGKIYNMYGPTETTVWSLVKDLTNEDEITIGHPIANTQICILNESSELVPYGTEGEICIAGDGVAAGYLYRDDLTKERFIDDVFQPGLKMYRTGDLGQYLPNGELACLGRMDSQVKIRGFRIELEEIETTLLKMELIKQCVVSTKTHSNDDKYLVGYYIADVEIPVVDIIDFLKKTLPEYMVPGVYVKIDRIPMTPNGKVNHLELPTPEMTRPNLANDFVEARTPLEKKIALIWSDVLNIDSVGILDNFFELGGNSLLISQVFTMLSSEYSERLDVADMFTYPTIELLAQFLEGSEDNSFFITLNEEFYQQSEEELTINHEQYTIDATCAEKIAAFMDSTQEELFYIGVYMYLLTSVSFQSKLEAMIGEYGEYIRIVCDFTDLDDLEVILSQVAEKYQEGYETVELEQLRNNKHKDSQELVCTIAIGEDEDADTIAPQEIHVQLVREDDMQINVSYNSGMLDQGSINQFFESMVEFIESVSEEL